MMRICSRSKVPEPFSQFGRKKNLPPDLFFINIPKHFSRLFVSTNKRRSVWNFYIPLMLPRVKVNDFRKGVRGHPPSSNPPTPNRSKFSNLRSKFAGGVVLPLICQVFVKNVHTCIAIFEKQTWVKSFPCSPRILSEAERVRPSVCLWEREGVDFETSYDFDEPPFWAEDENRSFWISRRPTFQKSPPDNCTFPFSLMLFIRERFLQSRKMKFWRILVEVQFRRAGKSSVLTLRVKLFYKITSFSLIKYWGLDCI